MKSCHGSKGEDKEKNTSLKKSAFSDALVRGLMSVHAGFGVLGVLAGMGIFPYGGVFEELIINADLDGFDQFYFPVFRGNFLQENVRPRRTGGSHPPKRSLDGAPGRVLSMDLSRPGR